MANSPSDEFYMARHRARDKWEAEWRNLKGEPSLTDAYTDGFWAARDWCLRQMLDRFKGSPKHHAEIRRLLGLDPGQNS